jgi:predicted nucleotidyltransferase
MSQADRVEQNDALAQDFMDFIASLNAHNVDFVLVGGYAVAVYGVLRATGDIDFLFRPTKDNVKRLVAAMADFGAPGACMDERALLHPDLMTAFGQEPFRIDLLNSISGVTFQEVWNGASEIQLQGERVLVIGKVELIANKRASGRPKDLQDLRTLEKPTKPAKRAATSGKQGRRTGAD